MVRCLLAVLYCAAALLFTACAGKTAEPKDNIAVIDISEAVAAHAVYPAWQDAVNSRAATQRLKDSHVRLAQNQAALIAQMHRLGERGHDTFVRADYTVRMSEAQLAEREILEKQRRQEKARIDGDLAARVAAVEEEYRLPLFNIKVRIESVNPMRRSRDDMKEEKERLRLEMAALLTEKAQRINAIYQEGDSLLQAAMRSHEQEANRRLAEKAEGLRGAVAAGEEERRRLSDKELAAIPDTFSKSIVSIDKQLVEQQLLADKLYNKMLDDVKSQVAFVAAQKKYTVVISGAKVNVKADDITGEVIAGLPKNTDGVK